jgi:hypothetical protein
VTNVITALRSALRRAGIIDEAQPPLPATPNAWTDLLDAMARQGSLYAHGLMLFARWCHMAGIAPGEVTASTLTDHETYLRGHTLRADIPDRSARSPRAGGSLRAPSRTARYPRSAHRNGAGATRPVSRTSRPACTTMSPRSAPTWPALTGGARFAARV